MKTARLTVFALLGILTAFHLILPVIRVPFKLEIDYNEGWNAIFCQKAVSGEPIYNHHTEWISVNYPPLSFYIIGASGRLLRDPLVAGRLVSLLSVLAIALGVARFVAARSRDVFASAFAGCFCLGSFAAFATHYVGMSDPQLLGHVFTMGALIIYVLDESILDKPGKLFIVAFLSSLGILTKHTLVAVPLAITADVLFESRKKLLLWLALGSATAAGLALLSFLIEGGEMFAQILRFPRTFSPVKLLMALGLFSLVNGFPLLAVLPWLRRAWKSRPVRLAGLYAGLGTLLGLCMAGGYGTDVNMFFDGLIGLSLLVGLFLSDADENRVPIFYRRGVMPVMIPAAMILALLCVTVLKFTPADGRDEVRFRIWRPGILRVLQRVQDETLRDAAFVRESEGPVICDSLLLCFLSRQEFVLDTFFVREAVAKGRVDESGLMRLVDRGYFGVIQLEREIGVDNGGRGILAVVRKRILAETLTENIKREVAAHYRVSRRSMNGVFYVPVSVD
jgi:hypothetical protein